MRNLTTTGALLLAVVLASACATPGNGVNDSPMPEQPTLTRHDGGVRFDTDSQQVANLWASAESARVEGRDNVALELLYEALDIDPQNSLLWSRAAELQLVQLDAELAETYAERSNSFAEENRALMQRNWMIIERSRSMRGDLLGQRSAHKQVQFFQTR